MDYDAIELSKELQAIATKLLSLSEQLLIDAGKQPELPESSQAIYESGQCLQCAKAGLKKKATQRGLCAAHYAETNRKLKAGEVNEDWLINMGLFAPKKPGGRKASATSVLDDVLKGVESELGPAIKEASKKVVQTRKKAKRKTAKKKQS